MKARFFKPVLLGLLIGIIGVGINLVPTGTELEEDFGLDLLFALRGTRQPPDDALVVSIDKESADALNLPEDPRKWPRTLHARIVNNLAAAGASVIAFDVNFTEHHEPHEDNAFAEAIRAARNIVLCECMKIENIPVSADNKRLSPGELNIAKILPPIEPLAAAAVAHGPFPLPKISNKVSQYWTFTTVAGDNPTFPVVAFQVFTVPLYNEFAALLERMDPYQAGSLPNEAYQILASGGIENLIREIRHVFQGSPMLGEKMLKELQNSEMSSQDPQKYRTMSSLVKLYQSDLHSRYLNFYGPARTVTTIPYHRILKLSEKNAGNSRRPDVKGKAVFVGLSQLSPVDQKESFFTVYSQKHGLDISGIEIAATAFANLLEDMPVRPVNFLLYLGIIMFWGALVGFICKQYSTIVSFLTVLGLTILYLVFAVLTFKHKGIWYPVITPLIFQSVLGVFAGVLWNYIDVKKERHNIRKAFGFFLPDEVVDNLARNIEHIQSGHQIVYGICLSTDAEQYSSLSESMDPQRLTLFMNRYYESIFRPIRYHGGTVSDVIGDSVLAIWVASYPDADLKRKACLAALDIGTALRKFNEESELFKLPTRIGLHSGMIMLGSVGALDHYEYRPVGDIVNTATRVEGLNKQVGTRILITRDVIGQMSGFLTREIGEFKLAGKSKSVVIYELIGRLEEADDGQIMAYTIFSQALDAFRRRSWDEAIRGFRETVAILGHDGPSEFYIRLCNHNKVHMPSEYWDGVIEMEKK